MNEVVDGEKPGLVELLRSFWAYAVDFFYRIVERQHVKSIIPHARWEKRPMPAYALLGDFEVRL